MKLYLRGGIWWCRVSNRAGRIVRKSTRQRDKNAAELVARKLEAVSASGLRVTICPTCGNRFSSRGGLRHHQRQ